MYSPFQVTKKTRVFKHARAGTFRNRIVIITLELPVGAVCRFDPTIDTNEKNRCNVARVVSIRGLRGGKYQVAEPYLKTDYGTVYRVGEFVRPHMYDRSNETCAPGIHFYNNRKTAVSEAS